MKEDLKSVCSRVISVAREAGEFIGNESENFDRAHVKFKGKSELVSYVDQEAEKIIVKGLRNLMEGSGFLTEEHTVSQHQKEWNWIIDPLDGTTNFVHGYPGYAVSIGLEHAGQVVLGVIYEINRDEVFSARLGGGACLNGKPIAVSPAKQIDESLYATGFPSYNLEKRENYLNILNALMRDSHGLRRLGSVATDLAYVACGRSEGFFEYNLSPWDVAAGALLVKEAGGTVTDFSGGQDYMKAREIVACGPSHRHLLAIIRKYW